MTPNCGRVIRSIIWQAKKLPGLGKYEALGHSDGWADGPMQFRGVFRT